MSTKTTPTISATHYVQFLKIGDQEAKIFICEASGQEQFNSLIPIYISQSSIAIVVADITDTSSFDKIQSCLDKIYMENCTEIPKILAVNKTESSCPAVKRSEIIKNYGKLFKKIVFVSAKFGNNIEELFMEAANQGLNYLTKKKKNMKTLLFT